MVVLFFGFLWCFKQAVSENTYLKQKIFAELERYCPPHCILASSSSMINLNLIGERTKSQNRIVGTHFFRYLCFVLLLVLVSNLALMFAFDAVKLISCHSWR